MDYDTALKGFFKVYNGIKKVYDVSLKIDFKPQDEDTKFSLEVIRTTVKGRKIIVRVREESDTEAFRRAREELVRYYQVQEGEKDGSGQKKRDMATERSSHGRVG